MNDDDIKEEKRYIDKFKMNFALRYGYYPKIDISDRTPTLLTHDLNSLLEIIDNFIPDDIVNKLSTIKMKTRKRPITLLRSIFCMLSMDMGYTLVEIGKFLNKDHSTIIYNNKAGYDLLENDTEFQKLYIQISTIVNPKIYPHARINEVIDNKQIDTKPVGAFRLHQRRYNVTRPNFEQRRGIKGIRREEFH